MQKVLRLRLDEAAAASHDGVLSRAELRALGWDRDEVARQVDQGRWKTHGTQTVAVHTAPLSSTAHWWRAVWEVGVGVAQLDGITALQVAGLKGYADDVVHVSVPHTANVKAPPGVKVHKVIRRVEDECVPGPLPVTRAAVATLRSAFWAVTDRQAALLLTMPVQQRLVPPWELLRAAETVRGRKRRAFVKQVVADVVDGAHSLGELDFARMCRARGLPEPTRQSVRHGPEGTVYLDVEWRGIGLVVEIDGSQHVWGLAPVDDSLRQNAQVIGGRYILRIPLAAVRLVPDAFMDQVCEAHAALTRRAAS